MSSTWKCRHGKGATKIMITPITSAWLRPDCCPSTDPDDIVKEMKVQKFFGVAIGHEKLCEKCGKPVNALRARRRDMEENIEQIRENFCWKCINGRKK